MFAPATFSSLFRTMVIASERPKITCSGGRLRLLSPANRADRAIVPTSAPFPPNPSRALCNLIHLHTENQMRPSRCNFLWLRLIAVTHYITMGYERTRLVARALIAYPYRRYNVNDNPYKRKMFSHSGTHFPALRCLV